VHGVVFEILPGSPNCVGVQSPASHRQPGRHGRKDRKNAAWLTMMPRNPDADRKTKTTFNASA
jgi:hypothetical protein